LRAIEEVVRDCDLKHSKFGHLDTFGSVQRIAGIVMACFSDKERLRRGISIFSRRYDEAVKIYGSLKH